MPKAKHWTEYPTKLVPESGCIRWLGTHKEHGYAYWRKRVIHRVVWESVNGLIPAGLVLDHVYERGCRYRDCINVAHLEPVTQAENARRMQHIQAQIAQTHCKHGHPLSGDNLNIRKDGKRGCRQCARDAATRSNARRRA